MKIAGLVGGGVPSRKLMEWEFEYHDLAPVWVESVEEGLSTLAEAHEITLVYRYEAPKLPPAVAKRNSKRCAMRPEAFAPQEGEELWDWALFSLEKPQTRAQCLDTPRPCPWTSCRHHLAIDVRGQQIFQMHEDRDIWDIPASCALDVAEQGEHTNEEVAYYTGDTRARIQQIENESLAKIKLQFEKLGLNVPWL